jgi:hypothetical protein
VKNRQKKSLDNNRGPSFFVVLFNAAAAARKLFRWSQTRARTTT